MKIHLNTDKRLVELIKQELKENEGYCPCVVNSKGQKKYKCPCEDFRYNISIGESCHCGLYIKDEM